jgi:hypothetical protein
MEKIKQREIAQIIQSENKDFSNKDLSGLSFTNLNLQGSKFRNSYIKNTKFEGCDLRWADFEGAYTDIKEQKTTDKNGKEKAIKVYKLDKSKVFFEDFVEIKVERKKVGSTIKTQKIIETSHEEIVPINMWEVKGINDA